MHNLNKNNTTPPFETPRYEELFYRLSALIERGIACTDENGTILYANDTLSEITGYKKEEILGRALSGFIKESRDHPHPLNHAGSAQGTMSRRLVWSTHDRKKTGPSVTIIPAAGCPGAPGGSLVVVSVDNDVQKLRKEIEITKAKLRSVFDNSLQYFVLLDKDKKIQNLNNVAKHRAKMYRGLDMSIGDSIYKVVVDEIRDDFDRGFDDVLNGISGTKEVQLKSLDNRFYWVKTNLNPIYADDNSIIGVCLSLVDIDKGKQAENALRESEERYRLLVELSPDAILICNEDQISFVNRAGLRLFGVKKTEQIIGTPLFDFVHPDERNIVRKGLKKIVESGDLQPLIERRLVKRDGTIIYAEIAAIPFLYKGKQAVHIIARDIGKRKEAERKLFNYQKRLKTLSSEILFTEDNERRRISIELHDRIGTPLALAKIKLEAFMESRPKDPADADLDSIHALLDQAILDARSLTFELSPPVLYELGLIAGLEWLADQIEMKHGLKIRVHHDDIPTSLDEHVKNTIFRSVRELLINIIKHAGTDNASINIRRNGGTIAVDVRDDGIGFDLSHFDTSSGRTDSYGLFSIKEKLSYIGGTIDVKSEIGKGTQVTLTAPLKVRKTRTGERGYGHKDYSIR